VVVGDNQTTLIPAVYLKGPPNTGSLKVTITPNDAAAAGASWRVDDSSSQTSGLVVSNLSLGGHTVVFQAAPGWVSPGNQAVTISMEQTTAITAAYKPNPGPAPGRPWANSLTMRFAPLPGTPLLLSIWDTRVSDYRSFVTSANYTNNTKWTNPEYANVPTNPVVCVSYEDARRFCSWLTTNEQSKGLLATNQSYRLPTDQEWSLAAGLTKDMGNEMANSPKERNEGVRGVYPWGTNWPPPAGAGNFRGQEVSREGPKIPQYKDPYPTLAPVGSFHPTASGFYDLAGNVWQWCSDQFSPPEPERVLRGGSWDTANRTDLLSSHRRSLGPQGYYMPDVGFRCVLDTGENTAPANPVRH
jgi:hypothetical protein